MQIKSGNVVRYFVLVLACFLLTLFVFGRIAKAETEVINNFSADIIIQKDGTIFVTENITYNFGSNQRHGIFRDIPLTTANGPRLSINVLSVDNEVGQPYQYTASITNDVLRIKIGNPSVLISGVKTYIIRYQVYNAIRTFNDHDELYWNITGNQWPVVIQNANTSIVLPDSAMPNVRMDCFTGPQGSRQKNCIFNQRGANVNYSTTQPLNINEGLTIVLGMPPGYIHNTYVLPSRSYTTRFYTTTNSPISSENLEFLLAFFPVFLIFLIIFVLIIVKLFAQRAGIAKPKPVIPNELKGQPVVVEYNPPDNLSPIEIGTLLDRRVDVTDISSVVIDLAVRGYIKIRYTVRQIRFWPDKKDFEFIKLKEGSNFHPADKIIFNLLFKDRNSVKLSDLQEQKTTFQSYIKQIRNDTEQYLHDKGYFDQTAKNKAKKLMTYLRVTTVVLILGVLILGFLAGRQFFSNDFQLIFLGLLIVPFVVFTFMIGRLTNKLTPQGISALAKILGFREFLRLTEKDKLRLLNAPELQPEMFEKFLPYAMVLGVEDKWAQKFEGIYTSIPDWYEDPTAASFNSYVLARSLMFFNSSFNRVFNITSPRSSSGFGGGGFSGGGFGGGGGGSW